MYGYDAKYILPTPEIFSQHKAVFVCTVTQNAHTRCTEGRCSLYEVVTYVHLMCFYIAFGE